MTKKEQERRKALMESIFKIFRENGYKKDRWGNWKKGNSRFKINKLVMRCEFKGAESGQWIRSFSIPYNKLDSKAIELVQKYVERS